MNALSRAFGLRLGVLIWAVFSFYADAILSYVLAYSAGHDDQILFGLMTAGFAVVAAGLSLFTFFAWAAQETEKERQAGYDGNGYD